MHDEEFNTQMRKFLREVGVTSQQAIEAAIAERRLTGERVRLKVHLTSEPAGVDHVVERDIGLPDGVKE